MAKTKDIALVRYPIDSGPEIVDGIVECGKKLKEGDSNYDGFVVILTPDPSVNRVEVEIVLNPNKKCKE